MKSINDKLNERVISDHLGAVPVMVFDSVPSTNDVAKALANSGAIEGTTVVANAQTEGRGRRGRSFFSPADDGVYFSVVLRPNVMPEKSILVTTAAAVAVCEAIEALTDKRAFIKWLNDVYVDDKKCVGILAEAVFNGDVLDGIIVGIGINVSTAVFPDDIKARAGCIGKAPRNELVAETVKRLLQYCKALSSRHMEKYRERCFVLGRSVTVSCRDERYEALAEEITDDGRLRVRTKDGTRELYGEEVSLIINDD